MQSPKRDDGHGAIAAMTSHQGQVDATPRDHACHRARGHQWAGGLHDPIGGPRI